MNDSFFRKCRFFQDSLGYLRKKRYFCIVKLLKTNDAKIVFFANVGFFEIEHLICEVF